MKVELVVARYQEDVSWVTNLLDTCDVVIYTKGQVPFFETGTGNPKNIRIPNIGREAHTYLYHIYNNLNRLYDYTLFAQGDPFHHISNFVERVESFISATDSLDSQLAEQKHIVYFRNMFVCDATGHPHHRGLDVGKVFEEVFGKDGPETYNFNPGAIMAVPRKLIQSKDLAFYENLLNYSISDPTAPWVLERLWYYLFGEEEETTS